MGTLTHIGALAALGYLARCATYAGSWTEVPIDAGGEGLPSLSIVVPARDEARSIERCVRSLLAQTHGNFEVIVVDDRSTDGTGAILAEIAAADSRLRVVTGAELPPGWVGKPWALDQGTRIARGRWLLFTDADSYHAAWSATSALSFARTRGLSMLTLATGQELGTFAERALLPGILGMVVFASGSIRSINDPHDRDHALANGQYILIERTAYDALGGHEALRDAIAEDIEIARRIKRDGRFRMMLAGGHRLCSVRMYHSAREIWDGFTKNVFIGADGNVAVLAAGIAFLLAVGALPPLGVARGVVSRRPLEAAESLAATLAVVGASAWGMGEVGMRRRLGVYAPLAYTFLAAIAANSGYRVLTGRGVEWRGRRYDGRPSRR